MELDVSKNDGILGKLTSLYRAPDKPETEGAEARSDKWLRVPEEFKNVVVVDSASTPITIYVSHEVAGSPVFMTWIARNRDRGMKIRAVHVGVDEIPEYRSRFAATGEESSFDLVYRTQAINLMIQAAGYRASDMHIRTNGEFCEVQVVVKGELRVLQRMTHQAGETLIRVLYQGIAQTKSDSLKPNEYQNAQIPGDLFGGDVGISSIRMIRGPSYPMALGGSFATLRLQYHNRESMGVKKGSPPPVLPFPKTPPGERRLGQMGYTPSQLEKLDMLMAAPSGIVLFTGPTGSGKTTTMFECLSEVARKRPWDRQVTAEDPIEYPMDWAVQLGIADSKSDSESGAAFLEAVRVMLRMAPNIILIGEVRGAEVASAAMNAAITGHLVISTLHVNDPYLFVERLEFMDRVRLQRGIFCDPKIVRGVIAQRLIPRLCPDCRVPLAQAGNTLDHRIIDGLAARGPLGQVCIRGKGCPRCAGDGTLGRAALAEIVVMDDQLATDFIEHGTAVARTNFRKRPGADPAMLEAAIAHVLRGEVDPRAVEKNIDLILPLA